LSTFYNQKKGKTDKNEAETDKPEAENYLLLNTDNLQQSILETQ
jgi:hypothetical protein